MTQNQSNQKNKFRNSIIILLSIIGLITCIAVLFPQIRQMIMDFGKQILHRKLSTTYQLWFEVIRSYAMGGICFILFFDYCTLTNSGRILVQRVKQEIKECLSEINFRSLVVPLLLMFGVYLLGILTIIRANFSYLDDFTYSILGHREWLNWSRYMVVFLSYFVQPEIRLTDISPIPQLLAAFILSCSSVLLVYILGNRRITTVRLLASIPMGLSPFFLECLSYKYSSPYMALSILTCIVPFLFVARKKAFIFCSIVSLMIMCMIYQIAAGIYLLIVVMLCFQYWNNREKSYKEILSFFGISAFAFCFAMLIYKFFFVIPRVDNYTSTTMLPFSHIVTGVLNNIKNYALTVISDLSMIWKIGIALVMFFFITKSIYQSAQGKLLSSIVSILVIVLSFILSYGIYSLLETPSYAPRALLQFGVFLAILCIYVVSDYKKIAIVVVLALNWCFLTFAFSYGNALADQARYAEFRIGILLHDLSVLYPDQSREGLPIQLKNSIDYTPSIENTAKNYPVIKRLVPKRLEGDTYWGYYYFLEHFNYSHSSMASIPNVSGNYIDFSTLDLPVVLDSYYHTIQSDGTRILVVLKH